MHAMYSVGIPRCVGCRTWDVELVRVLGPTCSIAPNLTLSGVRLFLVRDANVIFASISGERSS
jgi:hypothetical protein